MIKKKIKYKIHRVRLDRAPKEIYRKLSRLNNRLEGNSSKMSSFLKRYDHSTLYGIYAKTERGEVLGWALIRFMFGYSVFQIYVKKKHRQKGIGTRLWNYSKRFVKQKGIKRMKYFRCGTELSYPFFSTLTRSQNYILTTPKKKRLSA